jgi:hypothetical protein
VSGVDGTEDVDGGRVVGVFVCSSSCCCRCGRGRAGSGMRDGDDTDAGGSGLLLVENARGCCGYGAHCGDWRKG